MNIEMNSRKKMNVTPLSSRSSDGPLRANAPHLRPPRGPHLTFWPLLSTNSGQTLAWLRQPQLAHRGQWIRRAIVRAFLTFLVALAPVGAFAQAAPKAPVVLRYQAPVQTVEIIQPTNRPVTVTLPISVNPPTSTLTISQAGAMAGPLGLLYPKGAPAGCASALVIGTVHVIPECVGGLWSDSTYFLMQCVDGRQFLDGPIANVPLNPPTPCDQPAPASSSLTVIQGPLMTSPVGDLYPKGPPSGCSSSVVIDQVHVVECVNGLWCDSTYFLRQCADGRQYPDGPIASVPLNPATPCDQPCPQSFVSENSSIPSVTNEVSKPLTYTTGQVSATASPVGLPYPKGAPEGCTSPVVIGVVHVIECVGELKSDSTYFLMQCADGRQDLDGPIANVPTYPLTPCE